MNKTLKPYTIIPANLYVDRDADRQIENIIEDMGRPGYVLVSRQMGKTNLLLNAKRKLESPNDLFVYIDLSNPFDTSRTCFENIIDTALELNDDKLGQVGGLIRQRRKELVDTPPHKQHTNELRLLLNQIEGKLVIILDEIDALTKTDYSDQIFAQIRSIYFSRVNFPELERLTYILSGVVDPSDIIKDPKISPFNIGQKIFLNDFSRAEFMDFIVISNLKIPEPVIERIYHWTNGNPRLSWDICSEIENEVIAGKPVKSDIVDEIVRIHYLTRFDRPPVDNIREITRHDKEIRTAIGNIRNGVQVDDHIKNRLYLSGIINYQDNDVTIKNRIISESLSTDWLTAIEEQEKGYLKMAVDFYSNQDFGQALTYFERFLSDHAFEEEVNTATYYHMVGFSAYKLADFEKALAYFDRTDFDRSDEAKYYYENLLIKAICYTYLERYEEAHSHYKQVIDSGRKDDTYIKSLINYGGVSTKIDKPELLDETLEIFVAVADNIDAQGFKLKPSELAELKTIAIYNTAVIYSKKGDDDIAERYFDRALITAGEAARPSIMLALINHIKDPEREREVIQELSKEITRPGFKVKDFDPDFPLRFSLSDVKEIALLTFLNYEELFADLQPLFKTTFSSEVAELIYEIGVNEISKKHWDIVPHIFAKLARKVYSDSFVLTAMQWYTTLKYACYFNLNTEPVERFIEFAKTFESLQVAPDQVDLDNITVLISMLMPLQKGNEALQYIAYLNQYRELNPANKLAFLLLDHLELNIYKALSDGIAAQAKARQILLSIHDEEIKTQKNNFIGDTGLSIIHRNAQETLTPRNVNINRPPKYGRNDLVRVRYRDGITIETKFKKIESDLAQGLCILLN